MLTHVHKVIHLVVSTFKQGWWGWWSQGVVFPWPDAATGLWPDVWLVVVETAPRGFGVGRWTRRKPEVQGLCLVRCDVRWRERECVPERIGRWPASSHARAGASDRVNSSLDAYWIRPDTGLPRGAVRPILHCWHGHARAQTRHWRVRSCLACVRSPLRMRGSSY
jgi:hypothetical protein